MVYQKREELEAELHISTRENCLQSPMLKKDTSWETITSTTLVCDFYFFLVYEGERISSQGFENYYISVDSGDEAK